MDGGSESPGCLFKTVPASGFEEFCIRACVCTDALRDSTGGHLTSGMLS